MSIFYRISKQQKREEYTHLGVYAYIVPIYLIVDEGADYEDESGDNELFMIERNWIPSGSIRVVEFLWKVLTVFHPTVPPVFVTGDID